MPPASSNHGISTAMTLLLAMSCGLFAGNLYLAQPLAGPISAELGLDPKATGLIVTLTQIGYGLGLALIVPLGDLIENRRLLTALGLLCACALLGTAFAPSASIFLTAAFLIGVSSVAAQIVVPFAASMAEEASRGRVVGNVMGGLMTGIMLARPAASIIAEFSNWHVVFIAASVLMVCLAVLLGLTLPRRTPAAQLSYFELLGSLVTILKTNPVLRRRSLYQACLFGAFSLFWTTTPLLLTGPIFHMSQAHVAFFALAGAAGAVAAPFAGRMADRGYVHIGSALAMVTVIAAFAFSLLSTQGGTLGFVILLLAAIVIDFGVTSNLVLGQRLIFALGADNRSRLNGIFIASFFMGGAAGSATGGWAYATGGWPLAAAIGTALPAIAFIAWLTEPKAR